MSTDTPELVAEQETKIKRCLLFLWAEADGTEQWSILPPEFDPNTDITPNVIDYDYLHASTFKSGGRVERSFRINGGITKSPKPGQIYRFDMSADEKIVHIRTVGKRQTPLHAECVGVSDNHALNAYCLAMQAKHEATAANEKRAKSGTRNEILEFLKPVREAYQKLPAPARAQLLGMIVQYITRG